MTLGNALRALGALGALGALLLCPRMAAAEASAPAGTSAWPDTFVARVEALALLESLNADLLSHDSATATLERWCAVHRLASPPRIVAERVPLDKPPTPEQRRELDVAGTDSVRYRRVRLMCGALVLSEADNWYVPSRLTPEMNRLLDTTDVPFGKAVQALHFQRHILSSTLLWRPLPDGWERGDRGGGAAALDMPSRLLQHRALLALPDGTPISEVVETYTDKVLSFSVAQPETASACSSSASSDIGAAQVAPLHR
jgi:chorismate-pyruvate lyase